MSIRCIASLAACAAVTAFAACSDSHSTSPGDSSTANATVRLANATDAPLDLRQDNAVVDGGGNLAFAAISSCTKVSAASPQLTVTNAGKSSNLAGFDPSFDAGSSYTLVAFPGGGSATSFAMLLNAFRPSGGAAGFRILNATGNATFDTYVTAPGAALSTRTTSNTAPGTASAFVNVIAGTRQIRVTTAGSQHVVLDGGSNRLNAGTNYTIVVAPGGAQSTLRAFLVTAC
jgi:hypothetical protein